MRKKLVILLLVIFVLILDVSPSLASSEFYHKGNAYSSILGSTSYSGSTVVISAGAYYDRNSGQGQADVRVWSRNSQVLNYLGYANNAYNWAEADRYYAIYGSGGTRGDMVLNGTSPLHNTSSSAIVPSFVFDYLNFVVPGAGTLYSFIDATTKYINAQSGVYVVSVSTNKKQVEVRGNDFPIELSSTIGYGEADPKLDPDPYTRGSNAIAGSGAAKFDFSLGSTYTPYPIVFQGRVLYQIFHDMDKAYYGSYTIFSGYATVNEYINGGI
ncbi:MAG: hypothetical protein KGZ63_04400 [Clostridiales bacterium]|nr:hypothetical protein [Clostridiales bacterium]